MADKPIFTFETVSGAIDAEAGTITGVSIITKGAVRGWNVMADDTTLEQVKKCALEFTNGVKVKLNHYSGVEGIIGTLKNFRIKGKKLLADFTLMKSHPQFSYLIELCETMPEDIGFSISFSGESEEKNNMLYARCRELYSIDLVDQPAANPDGLFSDAGQQASRPAGLHSSAPKGAAPAHFQSDAPDKISMSTPATPPAAPAATPPAPAAAPAQTEPTVISLSAEIAELKKLITGMQPGPVTPAAPAAAPERKLSDLTVTELNQFITGAVARQYSAVGVLPGAAPASPTSQPAAPAAPAVPAVKSFDRLVGEAIHAGKKQSEAVLEMVEQHPEAYAAWRYGMKPGGGIAHFTAIAPDAKTA